MEKTCNKHGVLTEENILVENKRNGTKRLKCRICNKESAKARYEKQRIEEGRKRNSNWQEGEEYCQIHGKLKPEDVVIHKQSQNVNGIQKRCGLCRANARRKNPPYCKKHGRIEGENLNEHGKCKECQKNKPYNVRDRSSEILAETKSRKLNPEIWKEIDKKRYKRKLELHGREALNTREILRIHGLVAEQYEKMVTEQNNLCDICGKPETRASRVPGKVCRLVVDHDHETGKVRALLCHNCNVMLGASTESIKILELGIAYLMKHKDHNEKSTSPPDDRQS